MSAVRAAAQPVQAPVSSELGAFAFAGSQGQHLLAPLNIVRPELIASALCAAGRNLPVVFDAIQRGDPASDTGRRTAANLEKVAGTRFRLVRGRLAANTVCFLASQQLLANAQILSVRPAQGPCSSSQKSAATTARGRQVAACWHLARLDDATSVVVAEFEPQGQTRHAGVLVVGTGATHSHDMEATPLDPRDVWRAGDDGVLAADAFQVIAAWRVRDAIGIALLWAGEEGGLLTLYVSDRNRLVPAISDYLYWSPR